MSIPSSADVVVIGGGPAGSMCAADLALRGHDVVLLERESHPRDKVGESLIPDFWKFTDKLGVTEKIEAENFVAKSGAIIAWDGNFRAHTFGDFGYDRPAMHVERDRFDQILFEHAGESGVATYESVAATKIDTGVDDSGTEFALVAWRHDDGTTGTLSARYCVDATGQNGVISRQNGTREVDGAFRYLGVWGYFTGSRFLAIDGKAHDPDELGTANPVTFVSSINKPGIEGDVGWSWHITLRNKTSVGIVIPLDHVKNARSAGETWEEFFVRRVAEVPVIGDLLAPAAFIAGSSRTIRDYSTQVSELSGPGFFLCGDAAGFVDPIFSVGVVLGMYTAAAAAWAVDQAVRRPEAVDRTRKLFNHQLEGRFEVARSLALPRYRSTGEVSELAKNAIGFERSAVKELMYVVSNFTTRGENWLELVGGAPPELHEGQLRTIEGIDLT